MSGHRNADLSISKLILLQQPGLVIEIAGGTVDKQFNAERSAETSPPCSVSPPAWLLCLCFAFVQDILIRRPLHRT
jgi:hypothetical protein